MVNENCVEVLKIDFRRLLKATQGLVVLACENSCPNTPERGEILAEGIAALDLFDDCILLK
jgi:hypothetical protein